MIMMTCFSIHQAVTDNKNLFLKRRKKIIFFTHHLEKICSFLLKIFHLTDDDCRLSADFILLAFTHTFERERIILMISLFSWNVC